MPSVSPPQIVHRETMLLEATPEQVRRFIMTPARILDYFPEPIEGEVLEAGKAILCRGAMATSILEVLEAESTADCLVVKVTSAIGLVPDLSASKSASGQSSAEKARRRVEEAATFTMIEDWHLTETAGGTRLDKTWRDIEVLGEAPFDVEDAVRQGAQHETGALIEGWNRAALER